MSCLVPGHVIVAPSKGSLEQVVGVLSERTRHRIEIAYSIEDILRHHHLEHAATEMIQRMGALPFVAKVPEGEEPQFAAEFGRETGVLCSMPDFFIRPTGVVPELNTLVIDEALKSISCHDYNQRYGAGIKIAVLDTGIEPSILSNPSAVFHQQYDSEMRVYGTEAVSVEDSIGHGTLIAYIINRISPAAELLSVRVMRNIGTIGSFLAGIYLAEAEFKPDIFNLSLSVSCDVELCTVCNTPHTATINTAQVRRLLESVTRGRERGYPLPLFVAAAGNGRSSVSIPALFPRFIAVGAYDLKTKREADYSRHESVPKERYVLAPGGRREIDSAMGQQSSGTWDRKPSLFGTSFSAAFVTGTLARYLGLARTGRISRRRPRLHFPLDTYQFALDCLQGSSDSSWSGYDPAKHGLGMLRWNPASLEDINKQTEACNPCAREQIFIVVDTTGSMDEKLGAVADHIAATFECIKNNPVFRLVLYGDHEDPYTVYLHRVSESIEDIAAAIRSAPRTHGGDDPEALEDAIRFVNNEIESMKFKNARVFVFTDAPPHPPDECPNGCDFAEEIQKMKSSGVRIVIVGCDSPPSSFGGGFFDQMETCPLSEHLLTS